MSATDSLRRQRRLRIIEIAILTLGIADAILNAGSFMVILPVIIVALMVWSLRVNVRTVRLIQQTHRLRPDYAAIARMEREVYGEAFEHEGAPVFALTIGRDGVSISEMGGREERATGRMRPCIGCGSREVRVGGKCPACYQRAKRHGTGSVTVTYATTGDARVGQFGGAGGSSSMPNRPYPGGSGGLGRH